MNKFKNKLSKFLILMFTLIFSFTLLLGCNKTTSTTNETNTSKSTKGVMDVSYIDIGQGDSELIQVNGKNLLIDAGPTKSADKLIKYLKSRNVKTLDYVVATHPHEDHIGGMVKVLENFDVKNFLAPKVIHNTKTFENMVKAVKKKGLKIETLKAGDGDKFNLGKGVKVEVFSPNKDSYEDLNDYSPIMKITFGNNSFLFTGDAEATAEKEVLDKKYNLKADVIKVGHHGSHSSSTPEFIKAVNPSIAIMSLATDNKYGHPHKETIETFSKQGIKTYQTNLDGNILLESNGSEIKKK
ncbi:ComEC/Rec2 family competence protein [Clostridium tarantellae]|uniref:MBL fold metallo-hydrolase n=1 Tax=Clostridium tarantellae TaxID=39493 RepID=A0A6I1MNH8_9CLOT|nr:ComEC/Rec2 family competence protein [Clostridium tarantellae]MPQ44965.1 MBL fold metallo-hydrolase [Clostridium tarantellae]